MAPVNYRVSESEAVRSSFRSLLERTFHDGRLKLATAAARYMLDELAYDPSRFGESRGFLAGAQLQLRFAITPPLTVWFGVHEASKQVFILRIGLNRQQGTSP